MTRSTSIDLTGKPARGINALTFDVEEWFHAHALMVPRDKWSAIPSRLDRPIDEILSLLDEHDTRATFFVLGWIAGRSSQIVRRIHSAGHEIGCHGYWHQPLTALSRTELREDLLASKTILEEIIGEPVVGYRAPSYSVGPETDWVFDELREFSFLYDSSVYPARAPHGRYGVTGARLEPYCPRPGLWEFPLPTLRLFGRRVPAATGAYLRLAPLAVTHRVFAQNARRSIPVVVNLHPWELDPNQPQWPTSRWTHLRHYGNLSSTQSKLARLLKAYTFAPLRDLHARCSILGESTCRSRGNGLQARPTEFDSGSGTGPREQDSQIAARV